MLALPWRVVWIVALTALFVRLCCSVMPMKAWVDSEGYWISAQALLRHDWAAFLPERTPGFSLFLIPHLLLQQILAPNNDKQWLYQAVGFSQAVFGILTALLSADCAQRIFRKPTLSLVVGLLVAISPNLLWAEHAVLTESLYAFSCVLLVWLWLRLQPAFKPFPLVLLGILSGWIIWIRPIGLVLTLAIAFLLWQKRVLLRQWLAYLLPVVLMCLLWMGFQYQAHGFFGLNAGMGMNQLYKTINFTQLDTPTEQPFMRFLAQQKALYPENRTYEAVNDAYVLDARHQQGRAPWQIYLEDDSQAKAISNEAILSHPVRYLWVTLQEFYKLLTEPTEWEPYLVFWFPIGLLALMGSVFLWNKKGYGFTGRLLIVMMWGQLLLYPWLTVCTARYRIPVEPFAIILASYAVTRLYLSARQKSF